MRPSRYTLVSVRQVECLQAVHSSREAIMRRSAVATALVAVFVSYLGTPAAVEAGGYGETDLVANVTPLTDKNRIQHKATILDPDLVNAWGIAESATPPFWILYNCTALLTPRRS